MVERDESDLARQRQEMVEMIAAYFQTTAEAVARDSLDPKVEAALRRVPRHDYVPDELLRYAYADTPLPIGCGKTISQPFIVALMTDLLELAPGDRVLEVGTGLGYQAALLAELAGSVYSVEILEELGRTAARQLDRAGYRNLQCRIGDGGQGWPDHAPYDKIIVTAAVELIPPPLLQQLKRGGRMVIPSGLGDSQQLLLVYKDVAGRTEIQEVLPVRFSTLITSH